MSQRGQVFERVMAAGGCMHIDDWASKYYLVYTIHVTFHTHAYAHRHIALSLFVAYI